MNTSISTCSDVLEAAAHVMLIARTTKAFARGERGNSINAFEKHACQWCARGVIEAIVLDNFDSHAGPRVLTDAIYRLQAAINNRFDPRRISIVYWNDDVADDQMAYETFMEAAGRG